MKILPLIAAVSTLAMTATANQSFSLRYVSFIPWGDLGPSENPDVDGIAMIRYNSGSTRARLQIIINGLDPNRTYGVQVGLDVWDPTGLNTNSAGRAHYTTEWGHAPAFDTDILIFIPEDMEERDPTWEELRAKAVPM